MPERAALSTTVRRASYRPELAEPLSAPRPSGQPWDLPEAWWLTARVRYQTGRVEDVEFAVVLGAGERILAAAGRYLERCCVIDAEVYGVRPPMAAELIGEIRLWNAKQAKRIWGQRRPGQAA